MNRTPAYWPTRIMLVVGLVSTAAVVLLAGSVLGFGPLAQPCFGCERQVVLGLPSNVPQAAVAVGLALVGLLWMLRIFRGPRDEPPAWRYRH